MNLDTTNIRNHFKQWLCLYENTIKSYDRILAGEGKSRNQDEINNALKSIGREGCIIYDLTDLTELTKVREKCHEYKINRPKNTGGNHPRAAIGKYMEFLRSLNKK